MGDQLFVAGQVPLVEVRGFGLADVRQLTVHVVGPHQHLLDAWAAVNEWFDGNVSPATLLGTHLLGYPEQLVEIDAMIVRTDARPAYYRSSAVRQRGADRSRRADHRPSEALTW